MAESIGHSRVFQLVLPEVPDLFAQTTFRGTHSGFELCCPPEYKAQVVEYLYAWLPHTYDVGDCPVKVIGSDPTTQFSFMPAWDLSTMVRINYDFIRGSSHILPLEYPEMCPTSMIEFLEENNFMCRRN